MIAEKVIDELEHACCGGWPMEAAGHAHTALCRHRLQAEDYVERLLSYPHAPATREMRQELRRLGHDGQVLSCLHAARYPERLAGHRGDD